VSKDDDTQQCVPGFADVSRDLTFAYSYSNPGSGTLPVFVESENPNTKSEPYTLDFNDDGEAEIVVSYADVGEMELTATYTGSAVTEDEGLAMSGSDTFIAYPDHFNVTVVDNPAAADASGSVFTSAGTDFLVEVSAINADDDVTPNYGQESDPESVSLTSSLVAPSDGVNASLIGSFADDAFGTDCDGVSNDGYACGTFSWSEVGIIQLTPQVADGDYLGTGESVAKDISANVGRFIPDHFTISGNSPSFDDACSGGFTYLGQSFPFLSEPWLELTAVAVDGSTTQNYGGDFWKYSADGWSGRAYSHSPSSDGYTVSIDTIGSVSLSGVVNGDGDPVYDGVGEVTLSGEQLFYDKPATVTESFATNIDLTLAVSDLTDSDEVCYYADTVDDTCDSFTFLDIGTTEQRYGRMRIENVYGPETLDLQLSILTEYYNNGGYILNTDDSCTALDVDDMSLDNYTDNLNAAVDEGDDDDTSVSGSGSVSSGLSTDFSLLAPGDGNDGSVDVTYSLSDMSWLQYDWDGDGVDDNPTGKATFGIYQGNPHLIYTRESVW
jgi:MSHA biogenesis protein MshQ